MKNSKKILLTVLLVVAICITVFYTISAKTEPNNSKLIVKDINDTQAKIIQEDLDAKILRREQNRLRSILEDRHANEVPIITYHNIYKEEDKDLIHNKIAQNSISEENFKNQMKYLKDNGFYVATLDELYQFKNEGLELPRKTVVITFENGYNSVFEIAYPILKEYDFHSSVFIAGDEIRKFDKKDYPGRITFLNYDSLKKISDIISIESKTHSLYGLNNRSSKFKIAEDDIVSQDLDNNIETLGSTYFMFPNKGDEEFHNDLLSKKGFKLGLSHTTGYVNMNTPDYRIPRYNIHKNITEDRFKQIVNLQVNK